MTRTPFQFTLAKLMGVAALVAVICAVPAPVIPAIGLGLCLLRARKRSGFGLSLAVVLLGLYTPFGWLLLIDYPWTSYRLLWLKLWPLLPGFLPAAWLLHARVSDSLEFKTMGVTSFVLITGLTWLGSYGRWRLAAAFAFALLVSAPTAMMTYAAFRA